MLYSTELYSQKSSQFSALDVCILRRPLTCSWRSFSTCYTTAAVALFLYSRARHTSSSVWLSLFVFSRTRFASLFRDASRPAGRSAFVSAGALFSSLPALSVSSLSALCSLCFLLWSVLVILLLWSLLCSRLFTLSTLHPSLFCFCLISASTKPRARRVRVLHIHNHAH